MCSLNDPDTASRVLSIFSAVLDIDYERICESADIYDDLAASSLDKIEILSRIEKEFEIKLDFDQSASIMSLGDATRIVNSFSRNR
ncbi:acyl carrier protein [Nocardia sp. CA-128927]|uniref:acyl carrier protein n=1 Tax=Nocardia sp. CA-128927 TaxID=3239975 RepID=UPI003D9987A4